MSADKPFKTYEEQIEILKSRNLSINDKEIPEIKNFLRNFNYYSIINGYSFIFQSTKDYYDDNITFTHLILLYILDKALKELIFSKIQIIEKNLSSKIAYEFSKVHGEDHNIYLSTNNFNESAPMFERTHNKLSSKINSKINATEKKEYIKHYLTKYNKIPLWVLINDFTIGEKSSFFKIMKPSEKSAICRDYDSAIMPITLETFLRNLTIYRNICAHDDLLFSIKTCTSTIETTPLHYSLNLVNSDGSVSSGKEDIFSLVIIFKYLLTVDEFSRFFSNLKNIFNNFRVLKPSYKDKLFETMGFPPEWEKIENIEINANQFKYIFK